MKNRSLVVPTVFLRAVVVLTGTAALVLMLLEPQIEGRNTNATTFEIYFNDPFLAYAYLSSIPFFVGLYQGFRVLGNVAQNQVFSQANIKALQTIKRCAFAIVGLVALGELWIVSSESDDQAGGVFIGILITSGMVVIAATAVMFERILQNAMETKNSTNDFFDRRLISR